MWKAITEDALSNLLEGAEAEMATPVLAFWEYIRVRPVKWQLPEWGDLGGGFWVVAVLGP